MRIKFVELEAVEGQRKDGTVWTGAKIHGTKVEDGTPWVSGTIFDSDPNLADAVEELRSLDKGSIVDIAHKKRPGSKFWDITGITVDPPEAPKTTEWKKSKVNAPSTSNTDNGDKMSKAEWAAKNEADRRSIAKSVALKAAVDFMVTQPEPEAGDVVEVAKFFEPYLLGEDSDPLDPPVV